MSETIIEESSRPLIKFLIEEAVRHDEENGPYFYGEPITSFLMTRLLKWSKTQSSAPTANEVE